MASKKRSSRSSRKPRSEKAAIHQAGRDVRQAREAMLQMLEWIEKAGTMTVVSHAQLADVAQLLERAENNIDAALGR